MLRKPGRSGATMDNGAGFMLLFMRFVLCVCVCVCVCEMLGTLNIMARGLSPLTYMIKAN